MKYLLTLALLIASACLPASSFAAQPNFLVILSDDYTCRATGYNNAAEKTPWFLPMSSRLMPRSRARVDVAQTHRFPEFLQVPLPSLV